MVCLALFLIHHSDNFSPQVGVGDAAYLIALYDYQPPLLFTLFWNYLSIEQAYFDLLSAVYHVT